MLADHRNASRLEAEREVRVRGWLTATTNAILGTERQEAQVGAQGLLQLVTSLPERADATRLRDQVSVYRRTGIVGGGAAAVLVKGRDIGTISVEPETTGARIDGPAFLADHADASGLYASPWDGLLLVATARSVGVEDWRKVIVGVRVDDEFVQDRVAPAVPDREVEVAVLTRTGEVAGAAGPGGQALAAALSSRLPELAAGAGGRDTVLLSRVPTSAGARLALLTPLGSAAGDDPDAPAAWLAVGVPRRALDEDLRTLREELVGLGLAAAVLVACVAATLARRISGPVRELVARHGGRAAGRVRRRGADAGHRRDRRPRGRVRPDAARPEAARRRPRLPAALAGDGVGEPRPRAHGRRGPRALPGAVRGRDGRPPPGALPHGPGDGARGVRPSHAGRRPADRRAGAAVGSRRRWRRRSR